MDIARASLRRARPLLGTFVEIVVSGAAFAVVARVHRLMSFHDPDSDVSRLNRDAAKGPVAVDPWTFQVLQIAEDLRRRSAGVFDVAVASALQAIGLLPGSGPDQPRIPGDAKA